MTATLPEGLLQRHEKRSGLFSLRGRLGRARYIAYSLGGIVGVFLVMTLAGMALLLLSSSFGQLLYVILSIALLYVFLPIYFMILTVKRAHDFNIGGWLALLLLVPIVNLMFWFIPGTRGHNNYGTEPDPAPFGIRIAALALPLLLLGAFVATSEIAPEAPPETPATTLKPYTP